MTSSGWNRKLLFDFIELYESHPCLWHMDKEAMFYNKAVKKLAYMELVDLIKNDFPTADIKFVKAKIKNIRNSFRREYNKVENSRRIPDGIPMYSTKLW
ncbi:MADF domain-containing protein [Aphis craccivora]|uniref:MADF domain-containing protein n=1 Tax=Aphis craccivora TaxID=307492 RepID=A0A6G0YJJ5_APHCR|nr:MADF domain-containing protein [Aphis craccivora]